MPSHRTTGILAGIISTAAAATAIATPGIPAMDLSRYQFHATHPLPAVAASEASAVTWDRRTNSLFVIGDEGEALVQVSLQGELLAEMTLEDFDDTEGLANLGGGMFVIVEERQQSVHLAPFIPGGSVDRADLFSASIGPVIGNIGLEGASLDPLTGSLILVKEKDPQRVIIAGVDFKAGTAAVEDLFTPDLGLLDLSDVQVLASVPSLAGRPDESHLLILSQESRRLIEATRDGQVRGILNLAAIGSTIEGVTIDDDGVIYLVDETPELHVFVPGCLRDRDGDQMVGIGDVNIVLVTWGTVAGDVDGDGTTGFGDLLEVLAGWGPCPAF